MDVLIIYDDRCHLFVTRMFGYRGTPDNRDRSVAQALPGGMYYVRLAMRPFCPKMVAALSRPVRKEEWLLNNDCFDYRSARHIGALATRDGEWYSRCETALFGDFRPHCPQGAEFPNPIHAHMRVSWYPAHCAVTWLDGGDT